MKLNLGCGFQRLPGFVNVDSHAECEPDQVVDLEQFPWPWPDDSVDKIHLSHVLEHLGATPDVYLNIIREMFRVCRPNARITVIVPHPRSDAFISDPTHVRPITISGLQMFDQSLNQEWIRQGLANTPLGIYLGVDLRIESKDLRLSEHWMDKVRAAQVDQAELEMAIRSYYNVIDELTIVLRAHK